MVELGRECPVSLRAGLVGVLKCLVGNVGFARGCGAAWGEKFGAVSVFARLCLMMFLVLFFTRIRGLERRLVDELVEQAAEARRLRADNARLLAEGRQAVEIAKQAAGFGKALSEACESTKAAERDCHLLEQRSGVTRPSRLPASVDVASLWRSLLYP